MGDLSKINEAEFDKSGCKVIERTHFGDNCSNPGYVPVYQYGVQGAFPLIALLTLAGFWSIRRDF